MPRQIGPRAVALFSVAVILAAGASFYVNTEFPTNTDHCVTPHTFGADVMMTFQNRTYCGETLSVGSPVYPGDIVNGSTYLLYGPTTSVQFLGYGFAFHTEYTWVSSWLNVTISEPNGTVLHGGPGWENNGPLPRGGPWARPTWFAPDNESGVYESTFLANVTVLVEVGA